jgi:hypothetical protein
MDKVYYCVTGGCGNQVSGPGGMCGRCTGELAALARQRRQARDRAATQQSTGQSTSWFSGCWLITMWIVLAIVTALGLTLTGCGGDFGQPSSGTVLAKSEPDAPTRLKLRKDDGVSGWRGVSRAQWIACDVGEYFPRCAQ